MPVANGLFVQALPNGFRARAFGVMATGVQVIQGAAVLVTGLLAERFPIPIVVGLWSAAGVVLMVLSRALARRADGRRGDRRRPCNAAGAEPTASVPPAGRPPTPSDDRRHQGTASDRPRPGGDLNAPASTGPAVRVEPAGTRLAGWKGESRR